MTQPRRFRPRAPRHTVAAAERVLVQILPLEAAPRQTIEAFLIDFSRQGLRFQTRETLHLNDRVLVRLSDGNDFVWQEPATVLWSNCDPKDGDVYGGVFDALIEWEVLGEMLLRGILSME